MGLGMMGHSMMGHRLPFEGALRYIFGHTKFLKQVASNKARELHWMLLGSGKGEKERWRTRGNGGKIVVAFIRGPARFCRG